jgi:hypothetical protein
MAPGCGVSQFYLTEIEQSEYRCEELGGDWVHDLAVEYYPDLGHVLCVLPLNCYGQVL